MTAWAVQTGHAKETAAAKATGSAMFGRRH
jgi:hypothetical protein